MTTSSTSALIASVIARKSSISYEGTPSGVRAWMWIIEPPSSTIRRASAAYSSGVYGMAGHWSRLATAPEMLQVMMAGSSKRLMGGGGSRAAEGLDVQAGGGVLDQLREPPKPRLLALGTDHPVRRGAAVPRRPGVEVLGGGAVRAQPLLVLVRQLGVVALERVDPGLVVGPLLERRQPGRPHEPGLLQLRHLRDVDLAPVAAWLARREALHVAVLVDAVRAGVDPAEAERLVDRFRPAHPALAGLRLEVPDVD